MTVASTTTNMHDEHHHHHHHERLESPRPTHSPPAWLRSESPGPFEDVTQPPRSSSSLETTGITTGWTELFLKDSSAGGPPLRPQTPSPDTFFSTGTTSKTASLALGMNSTMPAPAQPKPIRKSSEAVAIDKLFESLGQGSLGQPLGSRPASPHLGETQGSSFTEALGVSPLIKQSGNEEEIFQTDLANVLVWFEKSLSSSQRITTAFTLFERLTSWQREFVLGMLKTTEVTASVRNQAHVLNSERTASGTPPIIVEAPPGFEGQSTEQQHHYHHLEQPLQKSIVGLKYESNAAKPSSTSYQYSKQSISGRRSPSPLHQQQQQNQKPFIHSNQSNISITTTSSMASSFSISSSGDLTIDQCNVELFKRDIPQWLRSLRLHKYTPAIGGLSQAQLLGSTDESLERQGVAALGARRKLLRLFEAIQIFTSSS